MAVRLRSPAPEEDNDNQPPRGHPKGVRLCRPSEAVLDLLPAHQGEFAKEDGERVVDEHGRRVGTG